MSFTRVGTRPFIVPTSVNLRRLIPTIYIVIIAGLGIWAGSMFFETREVYNKLKRDEEVSRRRLADAQARLAEQQKILDRLRSDPNFIEKVIRRQGYMKPGEVIFRFDD